MYVNAQSQKTGGIIECVVWELKIIVEHSSFFD
jgi:hypothetical protein